MKINNSVEYVSPIVEVLSTEISNSIAVGSNDGPGAGGSEGTGEEEI